MTEWHFRKRHWDACCGIAAVLWLIIVVVYLFIALGSTWIAHFLRLSSTPRPDASSEQHLSAWTDEFGRDILSRLMNGATNS